MLYRSTHSNLIDMSNFQMPEVKSIPETFFDALQKHVRQLEASLDTNERIAAVYNQTGDNIVVEHITHEGGAVILHGVDSQSTETSVFANLNSFQIAFKIIEQAGEVDQQPIGFDVA